MTASRHEPDGDLGAISAPNEGTATDTAIEAAAFVGGAAPGHSSGAAPGGTHGVSHSAAHGGSLGRLRSRAWGAWRVLLRPGTLIPVALLLIALAWALFPGLFTSASPTASSGAALQAPSLEHWFGTDSTGRDLYTRVIYGASESISAALLAVLVGLVFGSLIGVIAGSTGGWIDDALMRLVDVLLAIPSLLLSLSIVILLGFGTANAAIAVGVTSVATFARLSRSQVVSVRASEFIEAAYGSGGTFWNVLWRHVLPNSLTAVIALAALQLGSAILQISTLGFLGYGAPPPTPEWGLLISEGRDYIATAWWLTTLPGLVVVVIVLSTNRLSQIIGGASRSGGTR